MKTVNQRRTDKTMAKRKKINVLSSKHYTENKRSSNTNLTKTGMNSGAPERWVVPVPHAAPVV